MPFQPSPFQSRLARAASASLVLLLSGLAPALAADGDGYRLELTVPDAYRPLLERNLELARWQQSPNVDEPQLARLLNKAPADVRRLLETEGFYSAKVTAEASEAEGRRVVRLTVDPGAPTQVQKITINFTGPITTVNSLDRFRETWTLPAGRRFRHGEWEDAKIALLREVGAKRFPGAQIAESRAEVNPATDTVDLFVTINSGPVVSFGPVQIEGLQRYPRSIVENLNPVSTGAEYDVDALIKYQSRLQDSGYFSAVTVNAEPDPAAPAVAPIAIRVEENKLQTLNVGLGFSTNTGSRAEINYQHNSVLGRGWRSISALKVESKAQSLQSDLHLPVDASDRRWSFGAKFDRTDLQGVVTQATSAYAKLGRTRNGIETLWTLSSVFERQKISGSEDALARTVSLNHSWTIRRTEPELFPERGYQLNLQLGGASRALLSDQDFIRGYAKAIALFPIGDHYTVTLRGEGGLVAARSRQGIPSDFLFRTGGDTTVRGYAYQSLGHKLGDAIVGGRLMVAGSAEFTRWVKPQWGAAVFVDAGDAADTRKDLKPVRGYGFGVRWKSPIGAVNGDIAYGEATRKVRLHFGVGLAF